MKNIGCIGCHQLGQEATRTIPAAFGKFDSGEAAWMRRVQSGQSGEQMTNQLAGQFRRRPLQISRRLDRPHRQGRTAEEQAAAAARRRAQHRDHFMGVGRRANKYLHDLISSDRRNPTVNAYGPLYGSPEYSTDNMPILDPKTNKVTFFKMPVADPEMPELLGPGHAASVKPLEPSAYWGEQKALGHASQQPQLHVRREGPGLARGHRARHG